MSTKKQVLSMEHFFRHNLMVSDVVFMFGLEGGWWPSGSNRKVAGSSPTIAIGDILSLDSALP